MIFNTLLICGVVCIVSRIVGFVLDILWMLTYVPPIPGTPEYDLLTLDETIYASDYWSW